MQQSHHHRLAQVLAELRSSPAGLRGLWRGTVPSALRTGFGSAVYFTSLNAVRQQAARVPFLAVETTATTAEAAAAASSRYYPSSSSSSSSSLVRLSPTGNLLAGAGARTFAGLLLMPLTVIKVRYESSLYAYGSLAHAARDIYATGGGARGFFAGFGATAIRDAPYAGLYVLFYEAAKKRLSALYGAAAAADETSGGGGEGGGRRPPGSSMAVSRAATINFTSGLLAATTCSVISNPFDAVKTRIQLRPAQYRNIAHAAARMLREEGPRSFFDGLALRMSRKAMSSALAWTVYEELIRRAEVGWDRRSESVL